MLTVQCSTTKVHGDPCRSIPEGRKPASLEPLMSKLLSERPGPGPLRPKCHLQQKKLAAAAALKGFRVRVSISIDRPWDFGFRGLALHEYRMNGALGNIGPREGNMQPL